MRTKSCLSCAKIFQTRSLPPRKPPVPWQGPPSSGSDLLCHILPLPPAQCSLCSRSTDLRSLFSLQGRFCLMAWTSVVPSGWKVFSGPLHQIPPPLRSPPRLPNLNLNLHHFLSYLFVSCLLPIFLKLELMCQEGRDLIHCKVSRSWHMHN